MKLFLKPDLDFKQYDQSFILIDNTRPRYVTLNQSGHNIVNTIGERGMERTGLIDRLSKDFDIDTGIMEQEISPFLDRMIEYGFIIPGEKTRAAQTGEQEQPEPRKLKTLWLKVTNRCNLACPYCYAESGNTPLVKENLGVEDVDRILAEASGLGLEKIVITGGEPFLHKDIIEILKTAKSYGAVQALTNGTVFNEEVFTEAVKHVDIMQFSIDSHRSDVNERTRGRGSFEKTLETVKFVSELDFKNIVFSMTPTPDNMENIVEMIDFSIKNGARRLHINRYCPAGRATRYGDFDVEKFYEQIDKAYGHFSRLFMNARRSSKPLDFSIDVAGDFSLSIFRKNKKFNCGLKSTLLSIEANGDVYPCSALHVPEMLLGNIHRESLEEIYKKESSVCCPGTVDEMDDCKDCRVRYFCGGGCRALAYYINRNLQADEPNCKHYQDRIYKLMSRAKSA